MRIQLKYGGENDGVKFSPLLPMMFNGLFHSLGFRTNIKKCMSDYDYAGVPSDNIYQDGYQKLLKFAEKQSECKIDISKLPIDYEQYLPFDRHLVVGVLTSFGCKYHCKFCPNSSMSYVARDYDLVKSELEHVTSSYNYFEFFDNNVLHNPRFLELVESIPEGVQWGALINIDTIDKSILQCMRDAGCVNLYVGVESFNVSDIAYFGKPHAGVIDPKYFLQVLRDLGFNVHAFLIRALPSETPASFDSMIDWLNDKGISYVIGRMHVNGEPVLATEYLSENYLKCKKVEDAVTSRKNLMKFLKNYL